MSLERSAYNIYGTFSCVYILSFKHSGGWKIFRNLCCVTASHTFLKFSQPPFVFIWEDINTGKKALYCLSSIGLPTKLSSHIYSVRRNRKQKTFSLSNNSSLWKFLREHLLTSLMALHSSTTFFVVSSRWLQGCMKTDHRAIEPQRRIEIQNKNHVFDEKFTLKYNFNNALCILQINSRLWLKKSYFPICNWQWCSKLWDCTWKGVQPTNNTY